MNSKNKRLGLTSAALACAFLFAGPVSAQDWTGFYAGGSAGYGWGKADTTVDALPAGNGNINTTLTPKPSGVLFGAQGGYNWQSGKVVYGVEADLSRAGMSDKTSKSPITVDGAPIAGTKMSSKQEIDWLATLRGRVGYVEDKWLLYATGGLAWAQRQDKADVIAVGGAFKYPMSETASKFGWVAGAGLEWRMTGATSVKFEYLHYDVGHSSDVGNPTIPIPFQMKARWDASGNLLRAGVNYHF